MRKKSSTKTDFSSLTTRLLCLSLALHLSTWKASNKKSIQMKGLINHLFSADKVVLKPKLGWLNIASRNESLEDLIHVLHLEFISFFVVFNYCYSTSAFSSITWTVSCSGCLVTGEEADRSEASDLRIRQGHYNIIWKLLKHLPLVSDLDELGLPSVSISVAPS